MLVEEFIDQSNRLTTLDELIALFEKTVRRFGFNRFVYSLCTNSPLLRLAKFPGLVNHYPKAWTDHYVKNDYLEDDPIYKRSVAARGLFSWRSIEELPLTKKERLIMEERKAAGLRDGYTALISGPMGELVGVSVASDKPRRKMQKNCVSRLFAVINQFHLRFTKLVGKPSPVPHVKLSEREKAVLNWSSQGKSNGDIASILGISRKTVEFHFASIFEKL